MNKNLVVGISIISFIAFVVFLDLHTGPHLNEEFLFIIPILFTLWIPGKKSTVITAGVLVILTFLAYYYFAFKNGIGVFSFSNANRLYAIIGIFVTTYVVLKNKEKEKIIQANIAELDRLVGELKTSNADLEQYAYVASHDLQEPLKTITNYIGLLERRIKPDTDKQTIDFLERIINSADRMRTLIKDILSYSVVGKNRVVQLVNCNKVLKYVLADLDFFIKDSRATIMADKLPIIVANDEEMKQLFQNIISNAIKYRKADVPPEIRIRVKERFSEWEFSVEDNGIGIEKEYFGKVFLVFQRLHSKSAYPGTGIGLAICKKIVQKNKGNIWVESTPGSGSTFYFTISKSQHITPVASHAQHEP